MIVNPSSIKDFSNYGVIDNTILTIKLNNFDKKNLKKKQIIDHLRLKDIEAMQIQVFAERERYSKLLFEKDQLLNEVDKKKFIYMDLLNSGILILIAIFFILIVRYVFVGNLCPDNLPIESFTNE